MRSHKFIVCLGLFVYLLAGCFQADKTEIPIEDHVTSSKDSSAEIEPVISELDITDRLLPRKSSRVRTAPISHVMLHFTNDVSRNPHDPYNIEKIFALFEEYEVSAHYLIGRDGEIYRLVSEDRVAFHAGKGIHLNYQEYQNSLNDISIGIELLAIGTKEEMLPILPGEIYDTVDLDDIGYTDAQYESVQSLLAEIYKRHPAVLQNREHVMGHDEYSPVRKKDPGSLFDWSRIGF